MKKIALMIAGLGIAASAVPMTATAAPAFASVQAWQNINARQNRLEARINMGIRAGRLTRAEATRLRSDFRNFRPDRIATFEPTGETFVDGGDRGLNAYLAKFGATVEDMA